MNSQTVQSQTSQTPSLGRGSLEHGWNLLAKQNYDFYVEYVHKGIYKHGKHTHIICEHLQKVESGELKRLMIFLPPRHSKSMSVTETFPSYFIGKKPNRRVIQVSYGDTLARKFGRANRQKVNEYGSRIFDITLSKDTSAADNWSIQGFRGGMISVGIGGAITGEGADLLLVDDPIKNREEANSKVYRDKVWDEWQNTLVTRLQPNAAIIIILTRWHEDDLAGRLLNPEYGEVEDWTIIDLPAIAEDNRVNLLTKQPEPDLIGREPGQALWPEYGFDEKWAESTKKAVGTGVWTSLYQQRPSPEGGSMLKKHWWRYYTVAYNFETNMVGQFYIDEIIQSWDLTFKNTDGTDMVVGQIWGRCGVNKFLLDQVRARMEFTETLHAIINLSHKWPMAKLKLIEEKANGPAVISMLRNKVGGLVAVDPKDSKEARVAAVSPDVEAQNVWLPHPEIAPWITDFVEECASFPKGAYDDQVDAFSQALVRLMYHSATRRQAERDNETSDQKRIREHIKKVTNRIRSTRNAGGIRRNNYRK